MPMSSATLLTWMVPEQRGAVWPATGREQPRLSTSSWVRRPLTWMVAYSCPQCGTWFWTHHDQPTGCPEWTPVGLCSSPITTYYYYYHYSFYHYSLLFFTIITTHDLSLHQDIPALMMSHKVAVYIRPNHSSFFSIVTDDNPCGPNVLQ